MTGWDAYWAAQQADISYRQGTLSRYRVWMRSRPGQYAQYDGKVDVFAEDEEAAISAALDKLRRTSFPDRGADQWKIERVEMLD